MRFLKHIIFALLFIIALLISCFFINESKNDIKYKTDVKTKIVTEDKSADALPEPVKESNLPENIEKSEPQPATDSPLPNTLESSTEQEALNYICSLSIRCDTAVGKQAKIPVTLPDNGIIFSQQKIVFNDGESVFDVLVREMKKNNIHLEFVNTPFYNSAYIEGINNLYEFDFGELSGWMYKVNGYFPNFGSSQYIVQQGDKIEWVYTCDLGKDVGGEYSARNGIQK